MILGASSTGSVALGGIPANSVPPTPTPTLGTTTYGYDAHGNLVQKTLPNGETVTQDYDALNRVTTIEGQKPSGGGRLYRYGYLYDLAGNVVHIREEYPEPVEHEG